MSKYEDGLSNERTSIRIDIAFDLHFAILKDTEFEEEKRKILTVPTTDMDSLDIASLNIDEKKIFKKISQDNPDMAVIWQSLNKKLDRLINILGEQGIIKTEPTGELTAKCLDLSGNGISMIANGRFRYGQLIKLSISPPSKQPFTIFAIGKIMRVDQSESTPEKDVKLGVDFIVINEVDRERLITYLFKRHREHIRFSE